MASGKMSRTEKDFASQKQQLVDGRRKSGQLAICGNAFLDMTGAATAKARKNELNGERLSSYEQRIIDGKGDDSEPRIAGPTNVSPEPWQVVQRGAWLGSSSEARAGGWITGGGFSAAAVGSMEAVAGAVCFFLM
jgi:hypothetical protein